MVGYETAGDAEYSQPGQLRRDCLDQRIASTPVVAPAALDVPLVAARHQQPGEHVPIEAGKAAAALELLVREGAGDVGGAAIQPRRTAGARVLLVVPTYTVRSGARPCTAPIGGPS